MKKLLSLSVLIFFSVVCTNAQGRDQLFSSEKTFDAKRSKTSIASVREAEIQINFGSMLRGTRLNITLFDGKEYEAAQLPAEGLELRGLDDYTWRGKIVGDKLKGDVVLTVYKGFMAGLIYTPDGVYEITPRGDKNILMQLDQNLFPECGGAIHGDAPQIRTKTESVLAGIDSADRIDVLVLYTTATKNVAGGDTQAQTVSQGAIDITNTSYLNSKILQRVRLVHTQELVYTETGFSTDLAAMRTNSVVQSLREDKKADLVDLLSENTGACGIGYLMGTAVGGNQNNAYTVTARSCAVGNLSFAHELGHNMGSAHNPENGSGGTFPYSFGHWVNGSYRTVMSYVDPCTSGCTRRPYFSNPGIIFNGVPTGVEDARDNARSINNTAGSITNYRYSGTSLTLNSLNSGEIVPRNISRTINWTTDNITGGNVKIEISRDATTNWETLIASTQNDGSEVINIGGRPTKAARLRITSVENPAVSDTSVKNFVIK